MTEVLAALLSALAAILVWYLSARNLRRQDRDAKRREIRLQFLIDAYRMLESSGNRPLRPDSEYARNVEKAISDIQLFGSRKQVGLARELAQGLASTGHAKWDPLLDELRRELRSELDLEALADERSVLRIGPRESAGQRPAGEP